MQPENAALMAFEKTGMPCQTDGKAGTGLDLWKLPQVGEKKTGEHVFN